ncbi:MAG TPA: hypothetical protein VHX38_21955 [Pseudonocardiaceae bacterium]|jgi:hypothetical protein|nr:hypothetical protein [Pseudonocardiaceae bacterium]
MILDRGRHRDPGDGQCLLELVSVLAGEPWSDRPRCVHPVLAAVARRVNDECGDIGRARLVGLALPLIGTSAAADPLAATLVGICCRAALRPSGRRLPAAIRRRLMAAQRRAVTVPTGRFYRRVVAPAAVADAVTVLAKRAVCADQSLVDVLTCCVAAGRDVTKGTFSLAPLDIVAAEDHHVCTPYGMQSTEMGLAEPAQLVRRGSGAQSECASMNVRS